VLTPATIRRFAGLLVLGLVLTSFPARVWLFGACPVCGGIHQPILVVNLGDDESDPTPGDDPSDDPPDSPHDDRLAGHCAAPLPFCPTASVDVAFVLLQTDELRAEPTLFTPPVAAFSLIRPPRA
jgi:hypothetical protein